MFIVKWLRYLQGYVHFMVTGGFTERFLNLCARSGIHIWDVNPRGEYEMDAKTLAKNYKRMRPLARRSGVRMRLMGKRGAPFIVHRYRKRWGIVAAAVLFAVFLGIMSGFIWSIEIESSGDIPHEQIREELAEIGIREGTWRGSIDPREASRRMMLINDEIAWIALNIVGSTIHVEINPRTMPPDRIDDEKTPTNVVASHTGQIKYMEVYDGQHVLGVGDTVMAGEIIVSGITEDKWGNTMLKHARAVVKAWTNEAVVVETPLMFDEKTYSGEVVTRKSISIFGFELPLSVGKLPELYDEAVERRNIKLLGRALPFTVITREVRPYSFVPVTLSEAGARDKAMKELKAIEEGRFGEADIIDRVAVGLMEGDAFVIRADYVIERDIAVVREIFMENEAALGTNWR